MRLICRRLLGWKRWRAACLAGAALWLALAAILFTACAKKEAASPEAVPSGAKPLGQENTNGFAQTGGRPRDFAPPPPSAADPAASGQPLLMGE